MNFQSNRIVIGPPCLKGARAVLEGCARRPDGAGALMHGYPIGMGEAEPVKIRDGGCWSDIMAAPLDDDANYRPLEFEEPDLPDD